MVMVKRRPNSTLKFTLAVFAGAPFAWLVYLISLEIAQPTSGLGPDPAEGLLHYLGEWSMIMLLVAFSVTPVRRIFKQPLLARSRRMMGLFAFAYVFLHLLAYIVLYVELSMQQLLEDFVERTYITAGIAAFFGLLAMAITSTKGWRRRLGQNWLRLHKVIYLVVPLALLHLIWLRKDGFADITLYILWFVILLGERAYQVRKSRQAATV
jgi:sulfoxide reductase heme-binding subunit YedZ|tara:strand:+ start:566 stop:1195 length:630 start_codon:yes stop_codon:yes gene_type:complete